MNKKEVREQTKDALFSGLVYGLIAGLLVGLFIGLVYGAVDGLHRGLITGLILGLIFEFILGLIRGISVGFILSLSTLIGTQLIALVTNNPEFAMFDLVISLVLLVVAQLVGWSLYFKLKHDQTKGGIEDGKEEKD